MSFATICVNYNHCSTNTSGERNTTDLLIYYVTNPCNLFAQLCHYLMLVNVDEWLGVLFMIETLHVTQRNTTHIPGHKLERRLVCTCGQI